MRREKATDTTILIMDQVWLIAFNPVSPRLKPSRFGDPVIWRWEVQQNFGAILRRSLNRLPPLHWSCWQGGGWIYGSHSSSHQG